MHVAACFRLVNKPKNKPKGCLMVMANPLDHGHGNSMFLL